MELLKRILSGGLVVLLLGGFTYSPSASVDEPSVNIQKKPKTLVLTKKAVSQSKLDEVLQRSRKKAQEEIVKNAALLKSNETEQVINYYYIEDGIGYFYELTPENSETYIVGDVVEESEEESSFSALATIPNGIGGRAVIRQNGNYLTTTVRTATQAQMGSTTNGIAWTYSGFSGVGDSASGNPGFTVEADMGLQYSNSWGYVIWKPHVGYYNGTQLRGTFLSGYDQVQYKNGFKGGTDVNFSVYRNVNNNLRLTQSGYAECGDMNCNNTSDTWLTSILEIANTKVTSVTQWKILATVAGSEDVTGNNYADFKNIMVDGVAKTPVIDAQEYATINISGNRATITVSH
ncbi:YrpD family protein [Paenibacillus cisolokensis]|uniref:YrpD family protein n=1 Tax=Paenibacillus cisolokensis TaxID=1658519 RepID=UPI003D26E1E6